MSSIIHTTKYVDPDTKRVVLVTIIQSLESGDIEIFSARYQDTEFTYPKPDRFEDIIADHLESDDDYVTLRDAQFNVED
jgi:hypothetical protein